MQINKKNRSCYKLFKTKKKVTKNRFATVATTNHIKIHPSKLFTKKKTQQQPTLMIKIAE